ncbi:MAG: hypothetical protein ACFB4I_23575 [Cyanophyceae cyanobacterium]
MVFLFHGLNHLDQKLQQHLEKAQKYLRHLEQQDFACAPDALTAAQQWNRQLRYHCLDQIQDWADIHVSV